MNYEIKHSYDGIPIITSCCMCYQYKLEDGSYTDKKPILPEFLESHGYCSIECIRKGTGLSLDRATKTWERIHIDDVVGDVEQCER